LGDAAGAWLFPVVGALRLVQQQPVHMDFQSRRIGTQFKIAERNGARFALIVGEDELASGHIVVRDLEARSEERIRAEGDATAIAGSIISHVEGK